MTELEAKKNVLKAMDEFFHVYGGDEAHWETWITYGVPDEPCEEDFDSIAEDWKEFAYCCKTFATIAKHIVADEEG